MIFSIIRIKVSVVFFLWTNSVLNMETVSLRVSKVGSLIFCVCCCLSDFFCPVDFCVKLKEASSIMNLFKVSIPLLIKEGLSWRSWGIDSQVFGEFITGS